MLALDHCHSLIILSFLIVGNLNVHIEEFSTSSPPIILSAVLSQHLPLIISHSVGDLAPILNLNLAKILISNIHLSDHHFHLYATLPVAP